MVRFIIMIYIVATGCRENNRKTPLLVDGMKWNQRDGFLRLSLSPAIIVNVGLLS